MFNDASSELDVLVASDAIGMGLNLNISRIIFSTMTKFDGIENRELSVPEIKQIAGTFFFVSKCRYFLLLNHGAAFKFCNFLVFALNG